MSEKREYFVWRGNNTAILHTKYEYNGRKWPFEETWDPVATHRWFHDNWHRSITIALVYVALAHTIQRIMRDKKALSLRPLLFCWNVLLSVFSLCGCLRCSQELLHTLSRHSLRSSVCYSVDPVGLAAFWSSLFAYSKVAELLDTLFVVLRKRSLLFLHYYHHAAVLVLSWHGGRELTAAGRWFIWMNYSVHALMYSYYAVTSTGRRPPKQLSMLLTVLQTGQMLLGMALTLYARHLKSLGLPCQQTDQNIQLSFAIYLTFALLFTKFFYDTYINGVGRALTKTAEKKVH